MDDEKNKQTSKADTSKADVKKTKDSSDNNEKFNFKEFFSNIKGEFKKIIWPSREMLVKETITVITTSILLGVIISGMDYVFAFCYNLLMSFV